MTHILGTASLGLMEQAGISVATLIEGLERAELLRSRLTRAEVLRHLKILADSAAQVEPVMREAMPELDWSGWTSMGAHFAAPAGAARDDAIWFACTSLTPATLLWLRVYRQSQPALFRLAP
jgi:uncharacterized protein with HEPN domain